MCWLCGMVQMNELLLTGGMIPGELMISVYTHTNFRGFINTHWTHSLASLSQCCGTHLTTPQYGYRSLPVCVCWLPETIHWVNVYPEKIIHCVCVCVCPIDGHHLQWGRPEGHHAPLCGTEFHQPQRHALQGVRGGRSIQRGRETLH